MRGRPYFVAGGLLASSLALLFATSCAGGAAPSPTSAPKPTSAPATTVPTSAPTATPAPTATTAAAPAASASPAATTEVDTAGKELYETKCAACHQPNGAGGLKIGNSTSADLRAPHRETVYHNDDSLIARAILQGKDQDDKDLDPEMPRFQGKLTTQQASQIIAYMKTLTVSAATSTPAASASTATSVDAETAGKELYETKCEACHQPNGAGGLKIGNSTSADLRAPHRETVYHNDDSLIARAILQGKDQDDKDLDPEMPRFQGKLTTQQVSQIIAYMKTLHQ